jgi:hypothetical protein
MAVFCCSRGVLRSRCPMKTGATGSRSKERTPQTAERAAEAVLRALNPTPDLVADVKPDRLIDDE